VLHPPTLPQGSDFPQANASRDSHRLPFVAALESELAPVRNLSSRTRQRVCQALWMRASREGRLIHASVSSFGGFGSAEAESFGSGGVAASRVCWRSARTSLAVPWWTEPRVCSRSRSGGVRGCS